MTDLEIEPLNGIVLLDPALTADLYKRTDSTD